jgi:hypothetical protein
MRMPRCQPACARVMLGRDRDVELRAMSSRRSKVAFGKEYRV